MTIRPLAAFTDAPGRAGEHQQHAQRDGARHAARRRAAAPPAAPTPVTITIRSP